MLPNQRRSDIMDIGEYRLERSTDIYDIKVSKWLCYPPIFNVKGIKADDSDFGDKEDIDRYCEDKRAGLRVGSCCSSRHAVSPCRLALSRAQSRLAR